MDSGGPTYTIGRGVDVVFCGDTPTLQCNHIISIEAPLQCGCVVSTGKENPGRHSLGLDWVCLHKQKAYAHGE